MHDPCSAQQLSRLPKGVGSGVAQPEREDCKAGDNPRHDDEHEQPVVRAQKLGGVDGLQFIQGRPGGEGDALLEGEGLVLRGRQDLAGALPQVVVDGRDRAQNASGCVQVVDAARDPLPVGEIPHDLLHLPGKGGVQIGEVGVDEAELDLDVGRLRGAVQEGEGGEVEDDLRVVSRLLGHPGYEVLNALVQIRGGGGLGLEAGDVVAACQIGAVCRRVGAHARHVQAVVEGVCDARVVNGVCGLGPGEGWIISVVGGVERVG